MSKRKEKIFMAAKGNAIIIHGGGNADPSKYVLLRLANNLTRLYSKIYTGKYSFESLYTPEFWLEYNQELEKRLEKKRGTYFGTSRHVNFASDHALCEKAINCLKEAGICTVIVAGGDGSSRQVAETNDTFVKNGINIIFPVPLTIDGINGGESIGLVQAVRESIRQIENVAATALETRDVGGFGVLMAETQGRNRDDILANVLKYFNDKGYIADCELSDLLLRVIPANIETNLDKLIQEINESHKRTLVLLSEGAHEKDKAFSIENLSKRIKRKVRSVTIGYSSQSNGMTTVDDEREYANWLDKVTKIIGENKGKSICIVKDGDFIFKATIDYYAQLNPREGQKAEISLKLEELMIRYMAK